MLGRPATIRQPQASTAEELPQQTEYVKGSDCLDQPDPIIKLALQHVLYNCLDISTSAEGLHVSDHLQLGQRACYVAL